jgi:DNA-binding NarL/FixJ family response regulator
MKTTRVLLADDHCLMRAGIRALLEKVPGVEVVGEAGDGHQALRLVKSTRPHIVLMDIAMTKLNGLEATARVAREFPDVKVIMLSMHATEEYVIRALRAGAAGYLLKDAATAEVELALQAVTRGETYLSRAIPRQAIEDRLTTSNRSREPLEPLTPRQREILQLIAEGKSTKEVAFELKVSAKTVETHRAQLMGRLKIFDVASLVRYAIRSGVVSSER